MYNEQFKIWARLLAQLNFNRRLINALSNVDTGWCVTWHAAVMMTMPS